MTRGASPPSTQRRGARRFRLPLVIVILIAAAASALAWWWLSPPDARGLEPDWPSTVLVIAGDGVAGARDGEIRRARFSEPFGIAAAPDGTVYIADAGRAQRIRRISPQGYVSTVAGGDHGFADGSGLAARFSTPSALALDAGGMLYVADTGNHAIRRVTPDGLVSTLAGDGVPGYRDGPGRQARFNGPIGIAVDAAGRILVADTYNDRIRIIEADGRVGTLAGAGTPGRDDGPLTAARFDTPAGITVDSAGRIYVADTGNDLVRQIDAESVVTTVAASRTVGLVRPIGIAVSSEQDVYVTDDRGRIIEITRDGAARILAGATPGFGDGDGENARFRRPAGLAWAAPGRVLVSDAGNALVRLVVARSRLELRRPAAPGIAPRFDPDRADGFGWQPLFWPAAPMVGPHEIAGTFGEARGELADRLHSGVDVRVSQGAPVRAVREGVVESPVATGAFGTLNEWLRIGPVTYVHLRVGRTARNDGLDLDRFAPVFDQTGALVRMRVKRGARFATGEEVGTVNAFNHVHLNVGWPGEEHNPLRFRLVRFEDTVPPTIPRGGVRLYDERGQSLTDRARGRVLVWGRVQIVAEAWDQADGNRPGRRLGLYALGYQVLRPDGSPAPEFDTPRETITFDRLASEADVARLVYAPGSGIPYYRRGVTRFRYIVTNTLRDGVASEGAWDTARLLPGDYIVRVLAADIHGNTAVANRDVPVTVVPPPATEQSATPPGAPRADRRARPAGPGPAAP
jgi:sugar lactone lactonase YvrE